MSHLKLIALLKTFFFLFITFLLPIKGVMIAVGLSIFADTIIGIIKAKKLKQDITSRKLSNVISKMFLYEGAVVLLYVIDKFILGDIINLFFSIQFLATKLAAMTMIMIELKSINENYKSIVGYSMWDKFKELLTRAKDLKDFKKDLKD